MPPPRPSRSPPPCRQLLLSTRTPAARLACFHQLLMLGWPRVGTTGMLPSRLLVDQNLSAVTTFRDWQALAMPALAACARMRRGGACSWRGCGGAGSRAERCSVLPCPRRPPPSSSPVPSRLACAALGGCCFVRGTVSWRPPPDYDIPCPPATTSPPPRPPVPVLPNRRAQRRQTLTPPLVVTTRAYGLRQQYGHRKPCNEVGAESANRVRGAIPSTGTSTALRGLPRVPAGPPPRVRPDHPNDTWAADRSWTCVGRLGRKTH